MEATLCRLAPDLPVFMDSTAMALAQWYAGPGWNQWQRLRRQARPLLEDAEREVLARQLPSALATLPLALSGGQDMAGTPFGQAGAWRLDLATALRAGLRVDATVDERRDSPLATRAALDRLQGLVNQHEGDWEKALLAFACGPANLARAQARCKPEATLSQLAQAVEPAERPVLPLFMAFLLLEGLAPEARLWPALAQSAPPEMPAAVQVDAPDQVLNAFTTGKTQGDAPRAKPAPRHITVKPGDTLEGLARRHGLRVKDLKRVNGLQGDRIRAGDRLLLPGERLAPKSRGEAAGPVVPLNERGVKATFRWYTIRPGDTLSAIAASHPGTSVDAIMELNRISANIQPGQRIRIPLP